MLLLRRISPFFRSRRLLHTSATVRGATCTFAFGYGLPLPASQARTLRATTGPSRFESEGDVTIGGDKPILLKGNCYDGSVLFAPPVHITRSGFLLWNNILGPLGEKDLIGYELYHLAHSMSPLNQHHMLREFLAKHHIDLQWKANELLDEIKFEQKSHGHVNLPYHVWLNGKDTSNTRLEDYVGYYVLGLE